jgi:ribose transport system ATP-binding protein
LPETTRPAGAPERPPALWATGISKTFGATRALQSVDLSVAAGEVHGLVGHNGSGKSTLIKILSGYQAPDPGGEIRFGGSAVHLPVTARDLRAHGVRFVHQHLGLVDRLTVAENLWLEQLALGTRRGVSFRRLCRDADRALAEFGLVLAPDALVSGLSAVQKANLAILRALLPSGTTPEDSAATGLLVLDEPTAALPAEDKQHLYDLLARVVERGVAVLFVSHFLDEVCALSDRISVLRDGRLVLSGEPAARLDPPALMAHVVGETGSPGAVRTLRPAGPTAVRVRGLSTDVLAGVDVDLGAGEIVGVTGLLGGGHDHLTRALFGVLPATGTVDVGSGARPVSRLSPATAIRHGIGLVPGNRDGEGVIPRLSIVDNASVTTLTGYRGPLGLRRGRMRADAGALITRFRVRATGPTADVGALSGGNAQKVLMAKWLRRSPRLLLLEEPTQGVDVGARVHIEASIREAAEGGSCVLLSSSDPEQLAALCHRVLVVADGSVVDVLSGPSLTAARVTKACLTGSPRNPQDRSVPA